MRLEIYFQNGDNWMYASLPFPCFVISQAQTCIIIKRMNK